MPNDFGVRQGLLSKGIANQDIGYDKNTGQVQIKGQNFIKPKVVMNGASYDSADGFNAAYDAYSKNQTALATQAKNQEDALYNQGQQEQTKQLTDAYIKKFTDSKPATNPAEEQYNQMIAQIMGQMNNPQHTDPYSTPEYAAAQQQSQIAADRGIRANQEAAGASGFGRSTRNTEGAQRIQNTADQQLLTQVVPQIQNQLQNQKQQELQNMMNLLSPLQQQQQNAITNDRNDNMDMEGVIKLLQGQQDTAYNRSPDNPVNKGNILTNQLTQLQLNDYPAQSQAAAQKAQQEYDNGAITQKTLQYNLDQLKDPNSPINQANAIDLKIKQIDLSGYSETKKLELQKLKKEIAQIGVVHYKPQTAAEIAEDKVTLATANKQLADIAKGIYPGDKNASVPISAIDYAVKYVDGLAKYDNDGILTNGPALESQILSSGKTDDEMKQMYGRYGLKWGD